MSDFKVRFNERRARFKMTLNVIKECNGQIWLGATAIFHLSFSSTMSSLSNPSIQRGVFHKQTSRLELKVYDDFCLLFLGRPGVYYPVSTPAITNRTISAENLIALFTQYHEIIRKNS